MAVQRFLGEPSDKPKSSGTKEEIGDVNSKKDTLYDASPSDADCFVEVKLYFKTFVFPDADNDDCQEMCSNDNDDDDVRYMSRRMPRVQLFEPDRHPQRFRRRKGHRSTVLVPSEQRRNNNYLLTYIIN